MRWRVRILLGILAVAAVYLALALVADVRSLAAVLAGIDGRALGLALGLALAAALVRAWRWLVYLERLDLPAGLLGAAPAFTMGLASGRSGQVVKAYYLRRVAGTPLSLSIPATVGERVADVVSVLLLLVVGLALAPRADPRLALAGAALVALMVALLRAPRAARALARLPWLARRREALERAHGALRAHLAARELAAPALIGLLAYVAEVLLLVALAEGVGAALPFGVAALAIAGANLAAAATLIPGGIGVAEGGLLVALTLHGLALPAATALTLLFRLYTMWLGVALGAAAAGALHARGKPESTGASAEARWTRSR